MGEVRAGRPLAHPRGRVAPPRGAIEGRGARRPVDGRPRAGGDMTGCLRVVRAISETVLVCLPHASRWGRRCCGAMCIAEKGGTNFSLRPLFLSLSPSLPLLLVACCGRPRLMRDGPGVVCGGDVVGVAWFRPFRANKIIVKLQKNTKAKKNYFRGNSSYYQHAPGGGRQRPRPLQPARRSGAVGAAARRPPSAPAPLGRPRRGGRFCRIS